MMHSNLARLLFFVCFAFAACAYEMPGGSLPETAQPQWLEADCSKLNLPENKFEGLYCKENTAASSYCAFFENGRFFYCEKKDNSGCVSYVLNRWGSSLTQNEENAEGLPLKEAYYAYGKLARFTEYDYKAGLVYKVWLDASQTRLNISGVKGNIIDKFYFREGKPYVRYPGGNDMGEANGEWTLKDGKIFTDGVFLYSLPKEDSAPDLCSVFKGVCAEESSAFGKDSK